MRQADPMPPFVFDKTWAFDVSAAALWGLFTDTQSFTRWWPWLRRFDPVPLRPGERTRCSIGPPLPYLLNVELHVTRVVDHELVEVEVTGDARGPARLEVVPDGERANARLAWELVVQRPMLRMAATVARPVLQWGHDWVIENGVAQFRRNAIGSA
jgi:hypothetical protein